VNEILTVKEVAKFLQKHPDTIRRWIEKNILTARKLAVGKNGIYAILRNDMLELMVSAAITQKAKQLKKQQEVPQAQVKLPI